MKKNFRKYSIMLLTACIGLQACDKGFEAMNTNPNASANLTPAFVFTKSLLDGAGDVLNFFRVLCSLQPAIMMLQVLVPSTFLAKANNRGRCLTMHTQKK
jgi:hypothetical protein